MPNPLPEFERPPVIETSIGVEFSPLDAWQVPHFGLYWAEIRNRFPKFDVQPPTTSQLEDPDNVFTRKGISVVPMTKLEARCWFIDAADSMLVQVQNNKFFLNWRKRTEPYPRYETI